MINFTVFEASCWFNTQMDNQVSGHTQLGLLLMFITWLLVSMIDDKQAIVQEHTKHKISQHHEVGDLPL
jgi:hypothetical protein